MKNHRRYLLAIISMMLAAALVGSDICAREGGGGGGRGGGRGGGGGRSGGGGGWRPSAPRGDAPGGGVEAPQPPAAGEKQEAVRDDEKDGAAAREGEKAEVAAKEAGESAGRAKSNRIECNVEKGCLGAEDLADLDARRKALGEAAAALKGSGKLSLEEFKAMQKALDDSSLSLWRNKAAASYSYGNNVFANGAFLGKFNNEDIPRAEAGNLLREFDTALGTLRELAVSDMPQEERLRKQVQYNEFLNRYFEAR